MTSKEAFKELIFKYYLIDENGIGEHDDLVRQINKDLEVLEILRKHLTTEKVKMTIKLSKILFPEKSAIVLKTFEENDKDYETIKEWLEDGIQD